MKNKMKYIVLVVATISLMVLTVFLVGRSFGFFKYIKVGEITNVITINGIMVDVLNEESDALNLGNTYPMSDAEGLALTPFEFTMTNTSRKNISYSIRIENDEDKQQSCSLEDQTICPELTTDYIKYSYKKNDGTYTEPQLLSSNDDIIASGTIASGETIASSLIIWIDSEAGNEIQNHYFFGQLIITGEQQAYRIFKEAIFDDNKLIESEPNLKDAFINTTDVSGLYKSTATNFNGIKGTPTYYFRGSIENNYVDFAGFTWRIVRINEDGTVRLIMTEGINDNTTYMFNTTKESKDDMYYSNSGTDGAKYYLEKWYQTNIVDKGFSSKIAKGNYYCEQAKTGYSDYINNSGASMEVFDSYTPNFECEYDTNDKGLVSASVGLINYDEVVHTGMYYGVSDSNSFLYNSIANWWSMSPAGFSGADARAWNVLTTGSVSNYNVNTNRLLRPVINLKEEVLVTGNGTVSQPYEIDATQKISVKENDSLTVGTSLTATDGSKWHVLESSNSDNKYVTLLSDYNLNSDGTYNTECGVDINNSYLCSPIQFDPDKTQVYDETDSNNIGYFIKNTYKPIVTELLPGTTQVTLPTAYQIAAVDNISFSVSSNVAYQLNSSWLLTTNYWTKTARQNTTYMWNVYIGNKTIGYAGADNNGYGARPVITTLKSNLILN